MTYDVIVDWRPYARRYLPRALTSSERVAVIPLLTPAQLLAGRDSAEPSLRRPWVDIQNMYDALRLELLNSAEGKPVSDAFVELADEITRSVTSTLPDRRDQVPLGNLVVQIIPAPGGIAKAEDAWPARSFPHELLYDWSQKIGTIDPTSPCRDLTPWECIRQRLAKLRDLICAAKNPDGSPRYEQECRHLTRLLAYEPSFPDPTLEYHKPLLICFRFHDLGVHGDSSGINLRLDGQWMMNGGACAETTVIHELRHIIDSEGGLSKDLDAWYAAGDALLDAQARLNLAARALAEASLSPRDPAGIAKAVADMAKASQDIVKAIADQQSHAIQATVQRIQIECNAFLEQLDAGSALGVPAGDFLEWTRATASNFLFEVTDLPSGQYKQDPDNPDIRKAMCKCLFDYRRWLDAHPEVAGSPIFGPDLPTTYMDQWATYVRKFKCIRRLD